MNEETLRFVGIIKKSLRKRVDEVREIELHSASNENNSGNST